MRPYLNDYISTLSGNREERVSALIEEARVGKEQLDAIAARLENTVGALNVIALRQEEPETLLLPNNLLSNLRDVSLRIQDMYKISNLVSLLLSSHASILASDVKAIEDELIAMEKMASNFAFLLSDNKAYDYAHLEPFSDSRGRSKENFNSDRGKNNFGPEQMAAIRTDEGIISLPDGLQNGHGLTAQIIDGNATAFILSDTGLDNALVAGRANGWKLDIAAATPITSTLTEGLRGGAQVKLEFTLTDSAPSSEIKLVPYADLAVDVHEVRIFKNDDDQVGTNVLSEPRILDRSISIHFPIQNVSRFTVLINQSTFNKTNIVEKSKETSYLENVRTINKQSREVRRTSTRAFNIRKLERSLQSRTLSVEGDNFHSVSLPLTNTRPDRGPMNPALITLNRLHAESNTWHKSQRQFNEIMQEVMSQRPGGYTAITQGNSDFDSELLSKSYTTSDYVPHVVDDSPNPAETKFKYHYSLGLSFVSIGVKNPKYKGVFVSRSLPAPSDIGELRLKSRVDNYSLPVSDRDSKKLTSVEFSVTNRANPNNENDWIPILPTDEVRVEGERMFPLNNGVAYFRFPAQAGQLFSLYRNGYLTQSYEEIQGAPGEIVGLRIDQDTLGPDHIWTCDYDPIGDKTTVNFEPYGFDTIPLVSAFDSTGSGERFTTTGERNTITLSHEPFVDREAAKTSTTYSPITVQLGDGTVPVNLTDYKHNEVLSPPSDIDYYYHHSGSTIIFNTAIKEPFRVFYEYLQNNVRFRVVLRCNVKDFVSPKVDYVHVKAKTRKSDRYRL